MRITTEQYIRKPIVVDAVRVTNGNIDAIAAWCQGEVKQDEVPGKGTTKKYVRVRVHNPKNPRQTKAFVGDWILYTERGYKVYTSKAFHASFDVEPDDKDSDIVMGSTEIAPGVTINDLVAMVRDGRLALPETGLPEAQTEQMDVWEASETKLEQKAA